MSVVLHIGTAVVDCREWCSVVLRQDVLDASDLVRVAFPRHGFAIDSRADADVGRDAPGSLRVYGDMAVMNGLRYFRPGTFCRNIDMAGEMAKSGRMKPTAGLEDLCSFRIRGACT